MLFALVLFSKGASFGLLVEIVTLYVAILVMHYALLIMHSKTYQVVIAAGSHLFPSRTEKLSPLAPMVLRCNVGE